MKKTILLSVLLLATIIPVFGQKISNKVDDAKAIKAMMLQQTKDWNDGNIDAFMQGYWQSDSLMFIGSRGITYGWKATLDNYKKRYPDRATMGTLKFDFLKLDFFNKNTTCWLLGTWHLTRPEKGDVGGHFTLMLKKIKGKWLIISDHTS
jgi:ketosteroid isomerase-like protein